VRPAGRLRPSGADRCVVRNQHTPDQRVGRDQTAGVFSRAKCLAHPLLVVHRSPPSASRLRAYRGGDCKPWAAAGLWQRRALTRLAVRASPLIRTVTVGSGSPCEGHCSHMPDPPATVLPVVGSRAPLPTSSTPTG